MCSGKPVALGDKTDETCIRITDGRTDGRTTMGSWLQQQRRTNNPLEVDSRQKGWLAYMANNMVYGAKQGAPKNKESGTDTRAN